MESSSSTRPTQKATFPHVFHPRQRHIYTIYGLGITEVVLGIGSIIMSIAALAMKPNEAENLLDPLGIGKTLGLGNVQKTVITATVGNIPVIAQGIWGGLIFIASGSLSIVLKGKPTKYLYIANMGMAIIAAVISPIVLVLSGVSVAFSIYSLKLVFIHVVIGVIGFAVFIVTIANAVCSCGGSCYTDPSQQTGTLLAEM